MFVKRIEPSIIGLSRSRKAIIIIVIIIIIIISNQKSRETSAENYSTGRWTIYMLGSCQLVKSALLTVCMCVWLCVSLAVISENKPSQLIDLGWCVWKWEHGRLRLTDRRKQ